MHYARTWFFPDLVVTVIDLVLELLGIPEYIVRIPHWSGAADLEQPIQLALEPYFDQQRGWRMLLSRRNLFNATGENQPEEFTLVWGCSCGVINAYTIVSFSTRFLLPDLEGNWYNLMRHLFGSKPGESTVVCVLFHLVALHLALDNCKLNYTQVLQLGRRNWSCQHPHFEAFEAWCLVLDSGFKS